MKIPTPKEKKKNITLFMIMVFSLLLGMTTGIENFLVRTLFQIIVFVGQLLITKALLDDFYSDF